MMQHRRNARAPEKPDRDGMPHMSIDSRPSIPAPADQRVTEQRAAFLSAGQARRAAVVGLRRQALSCQTLDAVLSAALETARSVLSFDHAKICEYDARRDVVTVRAVSGWDPRVVGHRIEHASTTCLSGYALRSKRPVVVEDLRRAPELQTLRFLDGTAMVSGATVFIHGQRDDFGALTLQSTSRRLVLLDELDFLQAIADVVAAAAYRFSMAASARGKRASGDAGSK